MSYLYSSVTCLDPISELTSSGKLTPEALQRAERIASEAGEFVGPVLTRLGLVSERDMAAAFVETLGLPVAETQGQLADADKACRHETLNRLRPPSC